MYFDDDKEFEYGKWFFIPVLKIDYCPLLPNLIYSLVLSKIDNANEYKRVGMFDIFDKALGYNNLGFERFNRPHY